MISRALSTRRADFIFLGFVISLTIAETA